MKMRLASTIGSQFLPNNDCKHQPCRCNTINNLTITNRSDSSVTDDAEDTMGMTIDSGDPNSSSPSCGGGGAEKLALPLPGPRLNACRLASPDEAGGDCERRAAAETTTAGLEPSPPGSPDSARPFGSERVSVLDGCGGDGWLSPIAAADPSGPFPSSDSGEHGLLARVGDATCAPSVVGSTAAPSSSGVCLASVGRGLSGAGVPNDSLCASRL